MRDNPGHSFDHEGAKLIFTSNQKAKRQLVESALIATNVNCNLKPGDFPVCRITAPVVLKGIKFDNCTNSTPSQSTTNSSSDTATSSNIDPVISAPATMIPAPHDLTPATSNLTQALSNLAINLPSHQQVSPSNPHVQLLAPSSTLSTPIARNTRSQHRTSAVAPLNYYESPFRLQSQARALTPLYYIHHVTSPFSSHIDTPAARETYSHVPLSQCFSPKATTGATRKRLFVCNQLSTPDIFSPMAKRLRSSKPKH